MKIENDIALKNFKGSGLYPFVSKGQDLILIGKTWDMYKKGITLEDIAKDIKQTVEDVKNCINFCKKVREQ